MSATCGSCRGQCCYNALIRVSGDDVMRIARAQRLEPAAFVTAVPDAGRTTDDFALAFALDESQLRHLLVLRHSARAAGACAFLLLLGNHQPCGIYADRPLVCRIYPMATVAGRIAVRDDVICRPDSWDEPSLEPAPYEALLAQRETEWRIYERVVAVWNAGAAAAHAATFEGYLVFLCAAYAALDACPDAGANDRAIAAAAIDACAGEALAATAGSTALPL